MEHFILNKRKGQQTFGNPIRANSNGRIQTLFESRSLIKNSPIKGQVSVEFMLLIVIVLLYIQTVIQPSLQIAANSVNDSVRVGQARFAVEKIANAVEFAQSTYGTTKQTIKILIPKDSEIECFEAENKFEMRIRINSDIGICNVVDDDNPDTIDKFECKKTFFVLENISIKCSLLEFNPLGNDPTKNSLKELVVKKELITSGPNTGKYEVIIDDAE
ncbi:MAG: hypothetical protein Q7S21_07885 [archaeon]|nr:hypothetical protein [archaeon]